MTHRRNIDSVSCQRPRDGDFLAEGTIATARVLCLHENLGEIITCLVQLELDAVLESIIPRVNQRLFTQKHVAVGDALWQEHTLQ